MDKPSNPIAARLPVCSPEERARLADEVVEGVRRLIDRAEHIGGSDGVRVIGGLMRAGHVAAELALRLRAEKRGDT